MADLSSALPPPQAPAAPLGVDPSLLATQLQQLQQPQLPVPDWFKPVAQKIRQAEGTASGTGMVLYGGMPFQPGHDFPQWEGAEGPHGITHAAGPGQWQPATWAIERNNAARRGVDLDFSNPNHQDWAIYDRAARVYYDNTGRSLEADQKNGTVNFAAMSSEWEGLGSRNPAGVHRELQGNMFGAFNGDAREFSRAMMQRLDQANARYESAMRRAEDLQGFAMASERQMLAQAMKPPQNNHEAWNTWGTAASFLALLGGIAGRRHFTAALSAAGAMMQSADEADRGNYDRAYQRFRDQREFGFKAVELFVREANQALENAGRDYNHQLSALDVVSKAYQLPATLDHQALADLEQKLMVEKTISDLHKAQNSETELRLGVDELDREWERQNGGQPVPASIHNANVGKVTRERAGTAGAFQILTDPTTNQQYRYNPTTGEATTLDLRPYTPGGAVRVGTRQPEQFSGQSVDEIAKAISEYRMAPLSAWVLRGDWGKAVMNRVLAINPTYDQKQYQVEVSGARAFSTGRQGDTVRSMSVVISHLSTLQELNDALGNNDVRALNRLKNTIGSEFGWEGPADFNAAKEIAKDEVAKAVIGGQNAEGDRKRLSDLIDAAQSPAQLKGVVNTFHQLLTGQIEGLRRQYQGATGKSAEDFARLLTPEARQALSRSGATSNPSQPESGPVIRYDAQGNRLQ